ncbi:MAG: toll/interleukin-1 receptor domain-containing protein [Desulfobacterales bacterium]|nr:toll/interleukin-1 receptor domain-containing protein [Desulfobacterales bacterium]
MAHAATRRASRRWSPRSRRRAGRSGGTRRSTPGQEFDDQIERRTRRPPRRCVVVWTPTSVESRWVRGEAREAADRGVLVPVRFDGAELPIDVRAIHTTDLDGWGDDAGSAPFQALLRALGAMIARQRCRPGGGDRRATAAAAVPSRIAHLRAAVRQHERRPGAGVLQRRHHRGHHHRPEQGLGARRSSRATRAFIVQGQAGRRAAGRAAAQGAATCSRAACARRAAACASRAQLIDGAERRPRLGRALRPRPERHLRAAGRDLARRSSRR